jgi:predicted methyltransferase
LGVGTTTTSTAGEIVATNQITAYYSDERLKEKIVLITKALDKVLKLSGVTYNSNKLAESFGYKNKEQQVGVIAGDVEKVLPEAVKPAPFDMMIFEDTKISRSGENYKTVQYEKLVPLLIEAIKDLNIKIERLENKDIQ